MDKKEYFRFTVKNHGTPFGRIIYKKHIKELMLWDNKDGTYDIAGNLYNEQRLCVNTSDDGKYDFVFQCTKEFLENEIL